MFADVLRSASHLLGGEEANCRASAWDDFGSDSDSAPGRRRRAKVALSLSSALEENALLLASMAEEERYMEEATEQIGKYNSLNLPLLTTQS